MSRTDLTPDAVLAAMRDILVNGEYPSLARVRANLDTTASQQTLQRFMTQQWSVIGKQIAAGQPLDLPERVATAAQALWREAGAVAHENLKQQHEKLESREAKWSEELSAAKVTIANLQDQTKQLNALVDKRGSRVEELSSELSNVSQRLQQVTVRYEQSQAAHKADRKAFAAQIRKVRHNERVQREHATRENSRLQSALDTAEARLESQQTLWAKQVDEARGRETDSRRETDQIRRKAAADRDAAADELQAVRDQLQMRSAEKRDLENSMATAREELNRLMSRLEHAETRIDTEVGRRRDVEDTLSEFERELSAIRAVAQERQSTIDTLKVELRDAQTRTKRPSSGKKPQ